MCRVKRSRRWLFNGLTAILTLLFLAALAIWIRSDFQYDEFFRITVMPGITRVKLTQRVITDDGKLALVQYIQYDNPPSRLWMHVLSGSGLSFRHHGDLDKYHWFEYWSDQDSTQIIVPIWMIVALFGALPLVWFYRWKRHSQLHQKGYCFNCGYDLRATPVRCPECGTIPPKKEKIST